MSIYGSVSTVDDHGNAGNDDLSHHHLPNFKHQTVKSTNTKSSTNSKAKIQIPGQSNSESLYCTHWISVVHCENVLRHSTKLCQNYCQDILKIKIKINYRQIKRPNCVKIIVKIFFGIAETCMMI